MAVDIPRYRLHNQFLAQTGFTEPAQVVRALGAVQSQDYAGGKWGLGLRMNGATDRAIDEAFNEGKILRTHLMRPTWHFVAPEDIRWLLKLTAARVHAVNGHMYRKLELDQPVIRKSYKVLEKALQGGNQLTRAELGVALEKAGIQNALGMRLGYFMATAELDGIICSGGRRGKQFTYALLEERAPKAKELTRDEALVELTRRYFATRGPASLHDFTWWSGLTTTEARKGIEALPPQFVSEEIDGKRYWFDSSITLAAEKSPTAHLIPNYDEYFIGFKDRSAIGKLVHPFHPEPDSVALNAHIIILDGQIAGGWRRAIRKEKVQIEFLLITDLTKSQQRAVQEAADRYGEFLELPVEVL